jgi:hypothetical protein
MGTRVAIFASFAAICFRAKMAFSVWQISRLWQKILKIAFLPPVT